MSGGPCTKQEFLILMLWAFKPILKDISLLSKYIPEVYTFMQKIY